MLMPSELWDWKICQLDNKKKGKEKTKKIVYSERPKLDLRATTLSLDLYLNNAVIVLRIHDFKQHNGNYII